MHVSEGEAAALAPCTPGGDDGEAACRSRCGGRWLEEVREPGEAGGQAPQRVRSVSQEA